MRWGAVADYWRRRSKLAKTAMVLAILALIVAGLFGGKPAPLAGLLNSALFLVLLGLVFRGLRMMLSAMIWRLRNRLLITYVFIGVVPVLLVVGMAAVAAYILYGQIATYMAHSEVAKLQEQLASAAQSVARHLVRNPAMEVAPALKDHLPPELQNIEPAMELIPAADLPKWIRSDTSGLVPEEGEVYVRTWSRAGPQQFLQVSLSLKRALEHWLPGGIGLVRLTGLPESASSAGPRRRGITIGSERFGQVGTVRVAELPPAAHWADVSVGWFFTESLINWADGARNGQALFVITTRPSLLNARMFSTLGSLSRFPLTVLAIVAILFLVIEGGALLVGAGLTRSITGAVHDLYEGTQRINMGDFSYRIPVRSRDQLASLAESFNTMTLSLERLIEESKEKERLQSELQIAREVQKQLFPKLVPRLNGLELAGVCHPARVVSGDYYDFVAFDDRRLALAIGDISGKGISAALVMAGMQSALHAQLYPWRRQLASSNGSLAGLSTAALVAQLNRQLYESTAPHTFATFCCAVYDDTDARLIYTNAGHLAPIIVGPTGVRRLESGGLVMGILPEVNYEQDSVILLPGDLLVAFTDGITEPENTYRGEFGEDRLIELVSGLRDRSAKDVAQAILDAVNDWADGPEAQDDMTLLVARRL